MIAVRISEDALDDLHDGYLFYEAQEAGLGDYFSTCLRADIEGLKISAGIHRVVYRDYHRVLSRVFPYGIFYLGGGNRHCLGCDRSKTGSRLDSRQVELRACFEN